MVYRYMFRGYLDGSKLSINEINGVYNVSCSEFLGMVFMYFESDFSDVNPHDIVNTGLKEFPDGRKWEKMNDIFHYSKPLSKEHWQRKEKFEPNWRINYLKPDKVSEYIFYHWQLQEERPGTEYRYGIIFNIENIIVFYLEKPFVMETEKIPGALNTNNTPMEQWGELTDSMFDTTEKTGGKWIKIDTII